MNDRYETQFWNIIDSGQGSGSDIVKNLWDELLYLRHKRRRKSSIKKMSLLDRPVAVFTGSDVLHPRYTGRTINDSFNKENIKPQKGIELVLIFRSKACSWAASQSGGCTMCGYWNDRASDELRDENILNQFNYAVKKYEDILNDNTNNIIFKMYTSGSFCDPKEISVDMQIKLLKRLKSMPAVKEIIIESRPEYITRDLLEKYALTLREHSGENNEMNGETPIESQNKSDIGPERGPYGPYLEFGLGIESIHDFIRIQIINKGFSTERIERAISYIHEYGFGVRAYLLLKPPFITEYTALLDIMDSIRWCISHGVDTISVNPTNIQMNTICDELYKIKKFIPPRFYTLMIALKKTVSQETLRKIRIVSDPSAAGKEKGIHNCNESDPTNKKYREILEQFVLNQDIEIIPEIEELGKDECWWEYISELLLE